MGEPLGHIALASPEIRRARVSEITGLGLLASDGDCIATIQAMARVLIYRSGLLVLLPEQ